MKVAYDRCDADTAENSKLLDGLGVELLPFVQLIDDEGVIYWQKAGSITLTDIITQKDKNEAQRATRERGQPS